MTQELGREDRLIGPGTTSDADRRQLPPLAHRRLPGHHPSPVGCRLRLLTSITFSTCQAIAGIDVAAAYQRNGGRSSWRRWIDATVADQVIGGPQSFQSLRSIHPSCEDETRRRQAATARRPGSHQIEQTKPNPSSRGGLAIPIPMTTPSRATTTATSLVNSEGAANTIPLRIGCLSPLLV
uniref:Uncharacterized protein n=1 Tax=Oryza punctata TaxID=4537 RepID=A0A0E0JI12_ORYPU